jgi:ribosome-associated protein
MSIRSVDQSKNPQTPPVAPGATDTSEVPAAQSPAAAIELPVDLQVAIYGAQEKKAEESCVLDLRGVTSLTEFFFVCSGGNQRQNQAISDEVFRLLKDQRGRLPMGIEGYDKADWILLDYGDFIVHILSGQARKYYELERLWRQAKQVSIPDDLPRSVASLLRDTDQAGNASTDPAQA